MSTVIEDIVARKVLNSRGDETIEVDVLTPSSYGRASAPVGKSRGTAEVVNYPSGGVDEAIKKIEEVIAPELVGLNADFQEEIDEILHEIDGTEDFRVIGGNTALAVSLASTEAAANSYGLLLFHYLGGYLAHELPYPLGNIISGGTHGGGKTPDIQEYLVLPFGAESFSEAAITNARIHKKVGEKLSDKLKSKANSFGKGRSDEGAWIADIGNLEALEILAETCEEGSNEMGLECGLALDIAATSLWNSERQTYIYDREQRERDSGEQLEFIRELIEKYHLVYVEDPFHDEDYKNTAELTKRVKGCLICGDDLFATNVERLSRGLEMDAANAVIVKVNQVGTLTDAWETIELAGGTGYVPVMAHRSGDTCDFHIAHLAVAFRCPIIKTGVVEGARVVKINELIRIEEFLGDRAKMADLQIT
ncbi:phosphopyruvate hydratase [Candidatus Bathyarchaeota archaeon]|nr:phosphopyruvate hydratase [Candidatus Bathyarchaeota archaeon]